MNAKGLNFDEPKILVVSNNAFSDVSNNGKTLASFFGAFSPANVAQLYFSEEIPRGTGVTKFFRITDSDIIKSIFYRKYQCGRKICKLSNANVTTVNYSNRRYDSFLKVVRKYDVFRLIREVAWALGRWKTIEMKKWLDEVSPDIVFFCAGDSGFAYNISRYIVEKYNSKLVIYVTDDYVLPRKTLSVFWWLRRNYILNKMKRAVQQSHLFITISEEMRHIYKDLFGKDSILAMNVTEPMKDEDVEKTSKDGITLVYAGGLHYKRYESLSLLAESIRKYNNDQHNCKKVYLKVYSHQRPETSILKRINVDGASSFCGSLNRKELKKVLNDCDMVVHVESFDKKCLEATKLSISTKIPEYLSLGKPILAIGPEGVASLNYLKDVAFCINQPQHIEKGLIRLVHDKGLQLDLANKALEKYEHHHRTDIVLERLRTNLLNVMKDNDQEKAKRKSDAQ